jgi:hypothetical protein
LGLPPDFGRKQKNMQAKPLCRLSVLPDDRGLILGVDKTNIFERGVVYEVEKILDEIVIKPIGKYALSSQGEYSECSSIHDIVYSGMHLVTIEEGVEK